MSGNERALHRQGRVLVRIAVAVDTGFDRFIRYLPCVGAFLFAIPGHLHLAGTDFGTGCRAGPESSGSDQLDGIPHPSLRSIVPLARSRDVRIRNQPPAEARFLFRGVIQGWGGWIKIPRFPNPGQIRFRRGGCRSRENFRVGSDRLIRSCRFLQFTDGQHQGQLGIRPRL